MIHRICFITEFLGISLFIVKGQLEGGRDDERKMEQNKGLFILNLCDTLSGALSASLLICTLTRQIGNGSFQPLEREWPKCICCDDTFHVSCGL